MKLCDAIVCTLRDLDVGYLFGVSGANIEHIHDAVYRLGVNKKKQKKLVSVLTKSESGAAFMADGYARTAKRLGVCCATSGGGMLNLVAGIAESQTQGVPVLALVGQTPLQQEGVGGFQDSSGTGSLIDSLQLWQSITQYTTKITNASLFWQEFKLCLWHSINGAMGATAMLLPRDVMTLDVGEMPNDFIRCLRPSVYINQASFIKDITVIVNMLSGCRRPLLIVGEGVTKEPCTASLHQFISQTNIAVASTLGDLAVVDQSSAQYLGCVGVAGHPSVHQFINEEVDLVIAVGTALDAMTIAPVANILAALPLIIVNRRLAQVNSQLKPSCLLSCDSDSFFKALLNVLNDVPLKYEGLDHYQQVRQPVVHWPDKLRQQSCSGLSQYRAIELINQFLRPNTHLIFDAGNCAVACAHYLQVPDQCTSTIALGMGGMGYGVAASIGIALARQQEQGGPISPSFVFCGDGAFLMNGFEVHTAVEMALPIIWFIFNNQQHGMCVTRQKLYFENRQESSGYSHAIAFSTVVQGLGLNEHTHSHSVAQEHDLKRVLTNYLAKPPYTPCVIELLIKDNEIPPFTPFLAAFKSRVTLDAAALVENEE